MNLWKTQPNLWKTQIWPNGPKSALGGPKPISRTGGSLLKNWSYTSKYLKEKRLFLTSLQQTCNEYLIKFSENQSAHKLENRKTSPCSARAPNLLHVLPSWMVEWNKLCNPGWRILLIHLDFFAPAGATLRFTQPKHIALLVLVKVFFLWKVIVSNLWLGVGTGNDELSNNKLFSLFLDSVSINTQMKTICIACIFTNTNMMFTLVYTGWFFYWPSLVQYQNEKMLTSQPNYPTFGSISSSAHSNSVPTFPNNINRQICYW